MAATRTYTLTGLPVDGETLDLTGSKPLTFRADGRNGSRKVGIKASIAEQCVELHNAIVNDYNRPPIYTVSYTETTVSITHPTNTHFDSGTESVTGLAQSLATTPETSTTTVLITWNENATDKCNKVYPNLAFSQTVEELVIYEGSTEIYNNATFNASTLDIEVNRGATSLIIEATVLGTTDTIPALVPAKMVLESTPVTESGFGGSVTINTNTFINSEQNVYQVTDTTVFAPSSYESTNVFAALTPGDYLAHVKDIYGCTKSQLFTVTGEALTNVELKKELYISQISSFRFADRDTQASPQLDSELAGVALSANPFNFLSRENPELVKHSSFYHIMAASHKRRVQFKSSFKNHTVSLVPCGDLTGLVSTDSQIIVPTQKSDYISRNTYLEGNVTWNATQGRLAVSFTPGDEYDSAGNVIGSHTFDGFLPAYYEVNTELRINGEAMRIIELLEDSGTTYAITSSTTNNPETGATIESLHFSLPYEVWEFDVDASDVPHTEFYIKVEGVNGSNTERTYISEPVKVITDDEFSDANYHRCLFFGSGADGEVDYSFDLIHQRVLPFFAAPKRISQSEIDSQKLDNRIEKIDYNSQKVYETNFKPVPAEVAAGLVDLFNDTVNVEIDGMLCTTISAAEIEHKGQLSTVKVQLSVSGMANEFNNKNTIQGYGKNTGFTSDYYPVVG